MRRSVALLCLLFGMVVSSSGVIIISAEPDRQWVPELAFGPDTFLVVWQDWRSGQPNTEDVYAARVTLQGEVLDPHGIPIAVKTGALKLIRQPVWDGNSWFVHWMTDSTNGDVWLMGARVTRTGQVLDPEGKRLLNYYGDQFNQGAAFDGQNHFVVWYDARTSGSGPGLYGARITRDLTTLDPDGILLWSVPAGIAEVAFDGQNYCVVWPQFPDPMHPSIFAGRVRPDGVVLDTIPISVFPRETTGVNGVNVPDIAYGGGIYFIAACRDSGPTYPDIIGTRITPQGVLLDSSAIMVSRKVEPDAYRFQPRVAYNGEFFQVVWYSNTLALFRVIEGARIEPSGFVRDTGQVRVIREDTGVQHDPNVASGSGRQSLVVWGNEAGGEFNVYGVFVDTSGRQVGTEGFSPSRVPLQFKLSQNAPNPWDSGTRISYALPHEEQVLLRIYNSAGQLVRTLVSGKESAGNKQVAWDGRDDFGRMVPSGVYFYRLQAGAFSDTKKMVVIR